MNNKLVNDADKLAVAYSEYHRALQLGYEEVSGKQGKTETFSSVIENPSSSFWSSISKILIKR